MPNELCLVTGTSSIDLVTLLS